MTGDVSIVSQVAHILIEEKGFDCSKFLKYIFDVVLIEFFYDLSSMSDRIEMDFNDWFKENMVLC